MRFPRTERRTFRWRFLLPLALVGIVAALVGSPVSTSPSLVQAQPPASSPESESADTDSSDALAPDDATETESKDTASGDDPEPSDDSSSLPSASGWKAGAGGPSSFSLDRWLMIGVTLLALAGLVFWTGRKKRAAFLSGKSTGPAMELLGRLPLGSRRGLVMVRAADRIIVIGVSDAGIQAVLERPTEESTPPSFESVLGATEDVE